MNYKAFKRALATTVAGAALWTYAGLKYNDTTPYSVAESAMIYGIEAIVDDIHRIDSPISLGGRIGTYAGLAGLAIAPFAAGRKKNDDKKWKPYGKPKKIKDVEPDASFPLIPASDLSRLNRAAQIESPPQSPKGPYR